MAAVPPVAVSPRSKWTVIMSLDHDVSKEGREWKRIDATATAAPLGNLFERLSRLEMLPHASKYGGLQFFEVVPPTDCHSYSLFGGFRREPPEFSRYDLIFSRSGAALWLCCNVAPLFVELGKVVAQKSSNGRLDPLRLTTLIIDFLTTQTSASSTIDQSKDLSAVMLSMGLGLLPAETDWEKHLKELALAQAEEPEYVPVSPLIRWTIDVEAEAVTPALAELQLSLDRLLLQNPEIYGFELNRWAYFLLSLQLYHTAIPLAMRALVTAGKPEHFPERVRDLLNEDDRTFNIGAARDTLGWALCFDCRYAEA
jgi:hypothetical protein